MVRWAHNMNDVKSITNILWWPCKHTFIQEEACGADTKTVLLDRLAKEAAFWLEVCPNLLT